MMVEYISVIPVLTSDSQDGFAVSASSGGSNPNFVWRAFDDDVNTSYRSAISPSLPEYLTVTFPKVFNVARYTISLNHNGIYINMSSWEFQGLVNDEWITLHQGTSGTEANTLTFDFTPTEVSAVRIKCNTRYYTNSWGVDELKVYEIVYSKKTLVYHNNQYKRYINGVWETLPVEPTEQDFINYGMDDDYLEGVPVDAWMELSGEVLLKYYVDDPHQEESILTIHTEPFDLYEELGGSVEILYYTEDSSITEPKLIIEANYSPLDELEGDFEVVTWVEDEDAEPKIQMTALPNPRVVIPLQNLNIAGDLQKLTLNTTIDDEDYGVVRVAASGDGGQTWKSFKNGNWIDVELIGQDKIRYYWMSPEDIESITGEEWRQLNSDQNIRLAYYIRQDDIDLTVKIDSLVSNEITTVETPTLSSLVIIYDELDRRYSGLMFMDTTQEYYSTSFGEIIKYLDMGTMIAGQTSFDINVKLTNTYPFDVSNIHLWSEHDIEGLTVEFSKTINPFISENELFYDQVLGFDEVIDFYIRLSTSDDAGGSGSFDIRVSADQA